MGKKFKLLTAVASNEVSLCTKYNSGANKQTEFELVKNQDNTTDRNVKPVIEKLVKFMDFCVESPEDPDTLQDFKDFLNYWIEYDINNTYYSLLSEALQNSLRNIRDLDISKEEKVVEYEKLFNMFIQEYKNLPITKSKDGTYLVSLSSQSRIQDSDINPQNETEHITKEKTSDMKTEEQKNMLMQAFDLIKSAFGLEKTETPAEEQLEAQPEEVEESANEAEVEAPVVEEAVEKTEETEEPAPEEEAPVVEKEDNEVVEPQKEVQEEVNKEVVEESQELTKSEVNVEELIKAKQEVEKQLAELKKSNEEKAIEIEKMSFVQKAKEEYSMLAGTAEEIGEKLYSITKSNLDEGIKSFVLEHLKAVADNNQSLTKEVGSISKNAGDVTNEDMIYAKAEEIAKNKGITINQALREVK